MRNGICILPHLSGLGGPVSFQSRLVSGLQSRGVQIFQDPLDPGCGCGAGDRRHTPCGRPLAGAPAGSAHCPAPERDELDPSQAAHRAKTFHAIRNKQRPAGKHPAPPG